MIVPFNYLPFEFKNTDKYITMWKKIINTSDFTIGKTVTEFEKKFANYIGAKYCISTNSGTDALILSLKSLGVKKDDEVITVCNTFYATVGAIVSCGAKPVLVDCDSRYQINCEKIVEKITSKTKVIIPVHWAGASPDIKKIVKIAKKYNLKVVEDACMGIGGKINNKSPGTFGIVNAFSMHPLKSLNVMGDGGMIVTNNIKIYNWLLKYRNHGMIDRNRIDFWGVNTRLQPFQSVVALKGLKSVNKIINQRNKNANILDKELGKLHPNIIIPKRIKNNKETFVLYMILTKKRNQLLSYLNKKKIEARVHYPISLNNQKASKIYNYRKEDFPISNSQVKNLITLPVHQYLNKKHLNYMIKCIKDFFILENDRF